MTRQLAELEKVKQRELDSILNLFSNVDQRSQQAPSFHGGVILTNGHSRLRRFTAE